MQKDKNCLELYVINTDKKVLLWVYSRMCISEEGGKNNLKSKLLLCNQKHYLIKNNLFTGL